MRDTFRAAVELRSADGDSPGRLTGVIMRYGTPGVRGRESFAAGALRWPSNGIRVDLEHASAPVKGGLIAPIMRTIPIVSDDGAEVRIDAPLPNTQAARDLAVLMRSDPPVYSGLSVEFLASRDHHAGGQRVVDDAELQGVALVDTPSYPSTSVEVRSDKPPRRRRLWV